MRLDGFPIHPPFEVFYIHSMMFNTTSAVKSLMDVSSILEDIDEAGRLVGDFSDDKVLSHLQNVIIQAGSISKYCFPPRKGHEKRAQLIREALAVTDASPLQNRDLRNSLEHFDERLDVYLSKHVVGYIFPQYVGSELKRGDVPNHIFRAYYTDIDTFELLGTSYKFSPIAKEIMRVHKELQRCDTEGGRLSPRA
jgi:hypothetical protein